MSGSRRRPIGTFSAGPSLDAACGESELLSATPQTQLRRPASRSSPFVAEPLVHLRDQGFTGAPRYLGSDAAGYRPRLPLDPHRARPSPRQPGHSPARRPPRRRANPPRRAPPRGPRSLRPPGTPRRPARLTHALLARGTGRASVEPHSDIDGPLEREEPPRGGGSSRR